MNVAKTLPPLVVLWALFTPIPSYAAASSASTLVPITVNEDNSTGNSAGIDNATEPIYSIDAHLANARIDRGETLHLYVFLSGWGVPDYNRLYINWTAPKVVNQQNPGSCSLLWGPTENFTNSPTSDFRDSMYFTLPNSAFATWAKPTADNGMGLTYIESDQENGKAPIVVNINTRNNAQSGDYHVVVTFTYGNETDLKQAHSEVQFHVLSIWEQWGQIAVEICGGVIAFVALLVTIILSGRRSDGAKNAQCKRGWRKGQVKDSS